MSRPLPRTRDELERPHTGTPVEDEGRDFPFWLALPLVGVGVYLLATTHPLTLWAALRWGGFVVVGAAALLWRVPRFRRHPHLVATLAMIGAVAWVVGTVSWLVGVLR